MPAGRPTLYNEKKAKEIAEYLTHMTIDKACEKAGIDEQTYYNWLHKHKEFFELSTESRKTKAVHHFNEAQKVLIETKEARKNRDESFRSDLARLELDFHLRLAGKANQGLFGDKNKEDSTENKEPVQMNITLKRDK